MGSIEAGCSPGFSLGDTRACLRPDRCPYAAGGGGLAGCPELWVRALGALLPGDEDLALDIVGDVVDRLADGEPR